MSDVRRERADWAEWEALRAAMASCRCPACSGEG